MNKLLFTLSFLISLICLSSQSWALPPCPSSGYFHNCYGTYTWKSGDKYEGEWKDNKKNGKGTFTVGTLGNQGTNAGDKFTGEFKDGKRNGYLIYYYLGETEFKGDIFKGQYIDNIKHGQGTYIHADGSLFNGEYKNSKRNGQGTYIDTKGNKFVGEYKDGKRDGQGMFTYADGRIKEGIWKDGKFLYENKPTPPSNSKIEGYKTFCSEIGFTPGTEKFGECVVEAMKKG